jgi:hypothetical protein
MAMVMKQGDRFPRSTWIVPVLGVFTSPVTYA